MRDLQLKDGDLHIQNGDVSIAESDRQNASLIIGSQAGSWKEHPIIGVGVDDWLCEETLEDDVIRAIKEQLDLDDYYDARVKIVNGKILVEL